MRQRPLRRMPAPWVPCRRAGRKACAALLAACLPAAAALGHTELTVADEHSRAASVHRIPIYNNPILGDPPQKLAPDADEPMSLKVTCGKCHDYAVIRGGWHFSADDPNADPGRPAQPWLLVNSATGTWLPLSGRGWRGTYRPQDVGLAPWDFLMQFGRHVPGGGLGEERAERMSPRARWLISGDLEINCLACHSGHADQDQGEWAFQVSRDQNLRWAATAAGGLAVVEGAVSTLPSTYTGLSPDELLDHPSARPPKVKWDRARFDAKGQVFFNIPKKPLTARCYACHTNRPVGDGTGKFWTMDEDVHLAAGLSCADCHRHGLDHKIRRGYEGEAGARDQPHLATLSCRGCHLGQGPAGAGRPSGGRMGAPVPRHVGLPPHHLEKLSCTACHSGPWPMARAGRVQTSRIHALGIRTIEHPADQPPAVFEPVFMAGPDGVTGPHRLVWPAFWGRMKGGHVTPLLPEAVQEAAGAAIKAARTRDEKGPGLAPGQVAAGLKALATAGPEAGEAVYVSGGRLYRLSADGKCAAEDHEAAGPYAWPLAHDVRPAKHSLGTSPNCSDCHASDSPFFFGEVAAEGPASGVPPRTLRMYEFQGRDPVQLAAWALSYKGRPIFKIVGYAVAAVTALVLLLYALRALGALTRWFGAKAPGGQAEGPP